MHEGLGYKGYTNHIVVIQVASEKHPHLQPLDQVTSRRCAWLCVYHDVCVRVLVQETRHKQVVYLLVMMSVVFQSPWSLLVDSISTSGTLQDDSQDM